MENESNSKMMSDINKRLAIIKFIDAYNALENEIGKEDFKKFWKEFLDRTNNNEHPIPIESFGSEEQQETNKQFPVITQIKYKKGAMIWDHAANRYRQSMGIVLARYTDDEVHIFVWTDHMAKLLEVYSSVTKQWLPNTKPANR